jgi:hypothetical protein
MLSNDGRIQAVLLHSVVDGTIASHQQDSFEAMGLKHISNGIPQRKNLCGYLRLYPLQVIVESSHRLV